MDNALDQYPLGNSVETFTVFNLEAFNTFNDISFSNCKVFNLGDFVLAIVDLGVYISGFNNCFYFIHKHVS